MADNNFESIVRLFSHQDKDESPSDVSDIKICLGDKPGSLLIKQPHLNPPLTDTCLTVTHVYQVADLQGRSIYKKSVAPLVDSTLEGFNGTVISFGSTKSNHDNVLLDTKEGAVMRAAKQIFRCLKKLKASGLSSNLIVPCSYMLLYEQTVYDLLYDLSESENHLHMELVDGNISNAVISKAKRASDVRMLLEHGKLTKTTISAICPDHPCHTIFTIGIKYSEFGSMFAPISGTLSFITVNKPDDLDLKHLHSSRLPITPANEGIHEFISTIHRLTEKVIPSDSPQISSTPPKSSVYTTVFSEALGGNSKTILITSVPEVLQPGQLDECTQLLEIASKATKIENKPDKTELAKKALMDAYMNELRKLYGNHSSDKTENEALNDVASENKDAEIVAKALASAVKNKEDDGSDNSEDSDDEGDLKQSTRSLNSSAHSRTPITVRSRRITLSKKGNEMNDNDPLQSSSTTSFSSSSVDLTVEALISVIQDPDKGVPRARTGSLEHVKIYRGKGSVFSGKDIVEWFVKNIAGVESEDDAELLGQILLDKEAIFHSEGSNVFANSAYLFYYARDPRPGVKPVSLEEIQALLAQNKEPAKSQVTEATDFDKATETNFKDASLTPALATLTSQTSTLSTSEMATLTSQTSTLSTSKMATLTSQTSTLSTSEMATLTPENASKAILSNANMTVSSTNDTSYYSVESTLIADPTTTDMSYASKHIVPVQNDNSLSLSSISNVDEDEEDEVHTVEGRPNLKAIQAVPLLETLEKYSDYPHPLHFQAATSNESGVIKHLIHWYGVDQQDDYYRTPLMFAALGNKAASCRTLIEYGSVLDHRDKSGFTAVHIACYHGHKEALNALVNKGANIAIKDRMLHTAFHWSTVPQTTNCLKMLLRHSSVYCMEREADKSGLTPLHWAIFYDHVEHLKLLLPRTTDLLQIDSSGRTFAIYAIQKAAEQCLQLLLKYYPLLSTLSDQNQLCPLHHASAQPLPNLLTIVIKSLQDSSNFVIDVKDKYGRTPVHYAVLYGHDKILKLLLQNGANPHPKDIDSKHPLDLLKEFGIEENEIIKQILENTESITSNLTNNPGNAQSNVCMLF